MLCRPCQTVRRLYISVGVDASMVETGDYSEMRLKSPFIRRFEQSAEQT